MILFKKSRELHNSMTEEQQIEFKERMKSYFLEAAIVSAIIISFSFLLSTILVLLSIFIIFSL